MQSLTTFVDDAHGQYCSLGVEAMFVATLEVVLLGVGVYKYIFEAMCTGAR